MNIKPYRLPQPLINGSATLTPITTSYSLKASQFESISPCNEYKTVVQRVKFQSCKLLLILGNKEPPRFPYGTPIIFNDLSGSL